MKVYVLIDRSGSMAGKWTDTIGGVNSYIQALSDDIDTYVAVFDTDYNNYATSVWISPAVTPLSGSCISPGHGWSINANISATPRAVERAARNPQMDYQVVRDCKRSEFQEITPQQFPPRGGTPLIDAMAVMLDKAFEDNNEKTYIVVVTDGEENSSYTAREVVVEKLKRAEEKNWEVIFLGANFDNVVNQATSFGLASNKAYSIDAKNFGAEFVSNIGTATMNYNTTGARTAFTDEDRVRAKK